jgi:hypothetical protein
MSSLPDLGNLREMVFYKHLAPMGQMKQAFFFVAVATICL